MRTTTAVSKLNQEGFERYELASVLGVSTTDGRFVELLAEFARLPQDPYSQREGRFRRFGRGVLLPWNGDFQWIPENGAAGSESMVEYQQGTYNPQFVNQVRQMPGLTAPIRENALLAELIRFDFAQTAWNEADRGWPVLVGVHLIRLSVEGPGGRAVATPDMLHQDGEPYTFAHLIRRRDAEDGENVIATPDCVGSSPDDVPVNKTLARFVLREPLDSYGVKDDLVSHYVGPITVAAGAENAERAVLLVDFTPMVPRL